MTSAIRRKRRQLVQSRATIEPCERRRLLSTAVLNFHGDAGSTGQNLTETTLTPSDVNVGTFGKLYSTGLDAQAVAQPLYDPATSVTVAGVTSTHNVAYVATEHDTLYAFDADTGATLWKDSFIVPEAALTAGGATVAVSTVSSTDVNSGDTPEIGITGTPAIDAATGQMFLIAKTKQVVNNLTSSPHYVQTLYKVDIHTGNYTSTVIGDTAYTGSAYTYNVGPYVLDPHGSGAGVVTATVNGSAQKVIYFNALRQFSRVGVTLYNGNVYLGFASHGDNSPYHGWILGYSESTLAATAVFNANPDGSDDGIWQGGGKIAMDPQGNMYVETGNGTFDTTLNASGFPQYGDYGDTFIKIAPDPTSTATNQNTNGWGLKVADYFTPYNQANLSGSDADLGSGAPMVLPETIGSVTIGSTAHPDLLVGAGKGGTIYLIDRNNMGHYSATTDNVVQSIGTGLGGGGSYDTPTLFFDGNQADLLYAAKNDRARQFTIAGAAIGTTPTLSTMTMSNFGGSFMVSANGTGNGVAWLIDSGNSKLRAFNPSNIAAEYYDSGINSTRDALPTATKFTIPTVADGKVFVGTQTAFVAYGLVAPPTTVPAAPDTLVAGAASNSQINLTWHDNATNAFEYDVEESTDTGTTWAQIATLGSSAASYSVTGLAPSTPYEFRVRARNSLGPSGYSNTSTATTTAAIGLPNYPAGFGSAGSAITLNGSAKLSGSSLELTDGGTSEKSAVYTSSAIPIEGFNTSFGFQTNASASSADGFTFVIQNAGPTVVGGSGGSLGYATAVTPSVAIKFDLNNNSGEGVNSTGLFIDGDAPTVSSNIYPAERSVNLNTSSINLHSGDPMTCKLSYDGTTLTETITDNTTAATFTTTYALNIPNYVGGGYAYVGFTGATGGSAAVQNISSWTYSQVAVAPYAPSNLTVTPASGTELDLSWTPPYSAVTTYNVLQLINGSYSQIGQVPGTSAGYNVTGLTPGGTYSFKVVSVNSTGSSPAAGPVSGTTPTAPADVSNLQSHNVSSSSVDLSWIDNATNAVGYKITRQLESDNSQYITTLGPTATSFNDTGLLPGRAYDYEVSAYNAAGPSNGVDVFVETVPAAAATPTAAVSGNSVTLTWAAYGHAVTRYNVYRGGVEIAANVFDTTYTDSGLSAGTYSYTITAVDDGGEGPQSGVATATITAAPLTVTSPAAYLRLDADGVHLDVYSNSTGTGTPTQTIVSQISTLTVNGSAGANTVTVDFGNGNPLPASGLVLTSAGTESLTVIGTAGNDAATVNGNTFTLNGAVIRYDHVGSIAFTGGAGADTLTQTNQPAAAVSFADATSADSLTVNAGVYTITTAQTFGTLTVASGAKVDLTSSRVTVVSGGLFGLVQTGFAGGTWQGTGVDSSTAAADSTHFLAVGTDGSTARLTYFGDANLDGKVDGSDYSLIDAGFLSGATGWSAGDFNYDGVVDASDYTLIDNAFNRQPAALPSALVATPASLPVDYTRRASKAFDFSDTPIASQIVDGLQGR